MFSREPPNQITILPTDGLQVGIARQVPFGGEGHQPRLASQISTAILY